MLSMASSASANVSRRAEQPEDDQQELMIASAAGRGGSKIVDFYHNRSVLVTGASGFIGKVLIEKLLRSCPTIRRIFVLIRPKWDKEPQERLQELLKAPLFDCVRGDGDEKDLLHKKVIVVEGDVTQPNLGLSEQNLLKIMNEVSVVFHSAATVKFDEPLKLSIAINITGTKNMIEVCRKIPQLAALVHVSTAYANCDREEIDEHIYPVDMDPEKLIELASWLDQDTLQELKFKLLDARPNTYTYTKALAEWLLIKCARDLPVVICRPSIVVASWREPFSGWIDNVNGPTGVILGAGKGLIRSMYAESKCVADLIPVDTVINLIINLGWFAHVYRNHKQSTLNEAAESLSESLLGSGSSSLGCDEPFDDSTYPATPMSQTLEPETTLLEQDQRQRQWSLQVNDHNVDANDNVKRCSATTIDSNDVSNNNNNNSIAFEGPKMKKKKNNNINKRDHYEIYHHLHPNYQQQHFILDEGYGTHSPDSKSSTDSLSSSPSPQLDQSPNELATSINNSIGNNCSKANQESRNNNISSKDFEDHRRVLSFVAQRRLAEQKQADFDYKLKQFRHNNILKLTAKGLPEELADIPVFHCTSGAENPITWGRIQVLIITILTIYPSISTYRYPCGSFTNIKRLDDFYRLTLHHIPGYLVDFITQLFGGKAILVKIFKKLDQAASVLKAFTSKQWKFSPDNRLILLNELMSDEDKRLFNCDLTTLDWSDFLHDYVLGVRKFMLKEPISNLEEARRNLKFVYYRNLSLQILFFSIFAYYFIRPTVNYLWY